nr:MAG TPA: hypothetical protein [Caudoviricetes sp.]
MLFNLPRPYASRCIQAYIELSLSNIVALPSKRPLTSTPNDLANLKAYLALI